MCRKCKVVKLLPEFNKNSKSPDGKETKCRICHHLYQTSKERAPHRKAHSVRDSQNRKDATPYWADKVAIKGIYEESKRKSKDTGVPHSVDHIIPIRGVHKGVHVVCGLNIEINLEVVTSSENSAKRNRFNPEKEEEEHKKFLLSII